MTNLNNSNILIISQDGFEHSELFSPREAMNKHGATVHLASEKTDPIKSWKDNNWGEEITPDLTFENVDVSNYDALIIPGGQINPDLLRVNDDAVNIVKSFAKDGKVIAAICHGPWLLAEADIIKGRDITSYASIKTDMINAGGNWTDTEVAVDNGIVTSRSPEDIDAFNRKIVEEIQEGTHKREKLKQAA